MPRGRCRRGAHEPIVLSDLPTSARRRARGSSRRARARTSRRRRPPTWRARWPRDMQDATYNTQRRTQRTPAASHAAQQIPPGPVCAECATAAGVLGEQLGHHVNPARPRARPLISSKPATSSRSDRAHRSMPTEHAVGSCRRSMPTEHADGACRRSRPSGRLGSGRPEIDELLDEKLDGNGNCEPTQTIHGCTEVHICSQRTAARRTAQVQWTASPNVACSKLYARRAPDC